MTHSSTAKLAAGALAFAAVTLANPSLPALLTVPTTYLAYRVGGFGTSVSLADVFLVAGLLLPLVSANWANETLRRATLIILAYELLLIPVVAAHPTTAATFEWGHRFVLTAGSIFVGVHLARAHLVDAALRLFLAVSVFMSLAAIRTWAASGFHAAYPLGLHKNLVGNLVSVALLLMLMLPERFGLTRRQSLAVISILLIGLFATQSRSSMVGLGVGYTVWHLRSRQLARQLLVWVVIGLFSLIYVVHSVSVEVAREARNPTQAVSESIGARVKFRQQALTVWREEPVFGAGIRFYLLGNTTLKANPANYVFEALSESGVVGLIDIVFLQVAMLLLLRRLRSPLGVAAFALMVATVTRGFLDIYWVAGTQSLPWIVVGMAIGLSQQPEREAIQANLVPATSGRRTTLG